ncbi:hypothetical protein ACIRL0_36450 [Streptomyces sp. NPDC102365]|uniref:hypothetical protein n=1 Tax=Streptomyces sp. NPDC102365 TaxID=3366162 RepID=UPI0038265526
MSVQLADSTYRPSEPLRFGPGDGGGKHTIHWTAAPGARDTRQLYVNGVIAPRAAIRLADMDVTPTATALTIKNPALNYLGDFTNRYSPVQSISGTEITMSQPARDNNTRSRDTVQNSFLLSPERRCSCRP